MNLGKTIAEDNDSKFVRIEDFLKQEFKDVEITRFAYAKVINAWMYFFNYNLKDELKEIILEWKE